MLQRANAFLDLVDALTVAGHVNSPVALSEETPFRRKFNSIFDTLLQAEIDFDQPLPALYEHQPKDSEQIAGYEVYGLDTTPNERPEAETLEDRSSFAEGQKSPTLTSEEKLMIIDRLNLRSRKCLAFKTPFEVFFDFQPVALTT